MITVRSRGTRFGYMEQPDVPGALRWPGERRSGGWRLCSFDEAAHA
jgi:hypothetical protein